MAQSSTPHRSSGSPDNTRLRISQLSQRVAACEECLGRADGSSQVPLSSSVADLTTKVDRIFQERKELLDFEERVNALEGWLQAEHADVSRIIMHSNAKKNHVLHHADDLSAFAQRLSEVEELSEYINPPGFKEIPKHAEQLHRLEAQSAVCVGAAQRLHMQVADIAAEHHKTVLALSAQLLKWDALLSEKPS